MDVLMMELRSLANNASFPLLSMIEHLSAHVFLVLVCAADSMEAMVCIKLLPMWQIAEDRPLCKIPAS